MGLNGLEMKNRIENSKEIVLVGKCLRMSLANNKTAEIWKSFMPFRHLIKNKLGEEYYSVEVYKDLDFFKSFDPEREYIKWAALRVTKKENVPDDMQVLNIPAGLYAVFNYKGRSSKVSEAYQYILLNWLPNSDYGLDNRPHFAIMGEKYIQDNPESEEELWIPIKSNASKLQT